MVSNPIYLSTGWMFAHSDSSQEIQESHLEYASLVDGYELHPTSPDRVKEYVEMELPEGIGYTVHGSPTQDPWRIELLLARTGAETVVYHPTEDLSIDMLVEFYSNQQAIPTIENLDGRFGLEESEMLLSLKSTLGFGFTLDTQHVYEHDESLEYGWELLSKYGEALTQVHISGEVSETDSNHALVHKSDNCKSMREFIRRVGAAYPEVPLIIEGEYRSVSDVEKEVSFIRDA